MPPEMPNRAARSARILTVGHSNHPMQHFLRLLKSHDVDVVVDVRSQPYSKFATHFDREALKPAVEKAGLQYLYLGRELGGRPAENEFYDNAGHVLYDRLAATRIFKDALARLERGIRDYNVALLFAEENPAGCHRRLLVARVLLDRGVRVEHIRGDGRIQTEEKLVQELDPEHEQIALFQESSAKPWRSMSPVLRKEPSRHETPSEPASA